MNNKELDAMHLSVFMQIFNDKILQKNFNRSLKARFPETHAYIENRYQLLNGHEFSEKCYWLMNGYEDFPKCACCGNRTYGYLNIFKGYSKTCSAKCGNRYKTLQYQLSPQFIICEHLDNVFYDELIKLNLDLHSNKFVNQILKNAPYIWNYVWFRYEELNGHDMSEKLYWFLNKLNDFPSCCICGNKKLSFQNIVFGYSIHCNKCQYSDPNFAKSISKRFHDNKKIDPQFVEKIREKRHATNIKNGHSSTWNNPEKISYTRKQHKIADPKWAADCVKQMKQTKYEKYGNENYCNIEKAKQTNIDKYGVPWQWQRNEVKQKTIKTNQKNLGVDWPGQSEKCKMTAKQTCQRRYGVDNFTQSQKYKNLWKDQDYVERRLEKIYKTKRQRGTFTTSNLEELSYKLLKKVFSNNDIYRQYKDNIRYPYHCDFYIKSIDTFIECNYYWTHGKHWFNENDPNDIKRLEQLCEKDKQKQKKNNLSYSAYSIAINVWTKHDLDKRNCAIANKLNYVVVWNINDMLKYVQSFDNTVTLDDVNKI